MFYVAFFGVFKIAGMWGRMYIKKEKANYHLIIGFSEHLVARHPIEQPAATSKKKNYSSSFLIGVRSNVVTGVNFSSSGSI